MENIKIMKKRQWETEAFGKEKIKQKEAKKAMNQED